MVARAAQLPVVVVVGKYTVYRWGSRVVLRIPLVLVVVALVVTAPFSARMASQGAVHLLSGYQLQVVEEA
jgi:hypothetical protein